MSKPMDYINWPRERFEALPVRGWAEDIGEFDFLVILPDLSGDELHDSGYRYLDFVAIRDGEPVCRLAGGSDVLNVEGIGGYGKPPAITAAVKGWSMDCLPGSGLLQLMCDSGGRKLTAGEALSSFGIYAGESQRRG